MIVFPNAKINIGLHIVSKRPDGFHNIESVFYPLKIFDALEVIESRNWQFTSSGLPVPGENNICEKAYTLLKQKYNVPPVKMHLHKNIPIGAGLGGGSADGTFALKIIDKKFSLRIPRQEIMELAAQLGSDCPFFIDNTAVLVKGRGEDLSPVNLSLKGYYFVLVYPNIHISTAEAYAGITPQKPLRSVEDIIALPMEKWREYLKNDFESYLFEKYPVLREIKTNMYQLGAAYASMSGSGSSVYGIFEEMPVDLSVFSKFQVLKGTFD
jgi:4-diphosphocytidyl-2-C-methyl-D-erythritol kinase